MDNSNISKSYREVTFAFSSKGTSLFAKRRAPGKKTVTVFLRILPHD